MRCSDFSPLTHCSQLSGKALTRACYVFTALRNVAYRGFRRELKVDQLRHFLQHRRDTMGVDGDTARFLLVAVGFGADSVLTPICLRRRGTGGDRDPSQWETLGGGGGGGGVTKVTLSPPVMILLWRAMRVIFMFRHCEEQSRKTVSINHGFTRELRRAEAESNRGLPSLLTSGLTPYR